MALRDLVVSVLFKDNASQSLNDVDRNATGLGKSLAGVAATLGGIFALGKMKDLATDMVAAAGEAEALNAQFETVFGTLQDEANASIDAMAEDFGMLPSRLSPTLTKITSMFKGFGMSVEDSMEASGVAVELAADAAAFYDVAMSDSTGALTSFLKGNTNAAESIGIFATAAGMASFASDELGLNWKKLDEGGKQLVRLKYIQKMQEAAGATGQAAREADGYENVLGNLQQSWIDLKAKLGMAIFDVAIDGMKGMATWMSSINTDSIVKNLKAFGSYMNDTFGPAFNTIKNVAGAALGVVKSFGKTVSDSWGSIKGVVTPVIKAFALFGGVVTTIAASSMILSVVFAGIVAAISFLLSPVALVAAGVTALVFGFQSAYKHSEPFRKAIDGVVAAFKGLTELLSGNNAKAFDIMAAAGLDAKQMLKVRDFGVSLQVGMDKIETIFGGVGTLFSGGGSGELLEALGFSPEMITTITGFIDSIKTMVTGFVAHLATKWTEIQPSIMMLIENFMSMKDTAISIFTTLMSALQPIFSAIGTAFRIIADIAVMVFNAIIAPAIQFVITMFQTLWVVVGPILSLIGALIGTTFAVLQVVWDTILKPVAEWLLSSFVMAFEAMQGQLAKATESFGWLGDKISGVVTWFKSVTDAVKNFKVPNWLSSLGGGGTVKFEETTKAGVDGSHATGLARVGQDGYIAELHKDESVLTAQQSDGMRSMGMLGSRGERPILNLPSQEGPRGVSNTVAKTDNQNVFNFHISGENAKDIAAEVRQAIDDVFAGLNAATP